VDLALSATASAAAAAPAAAVAPNMLALSLTAMDLRHALAFVVCFVVATAFHEYAHAITARRLGDRTGESEGRLTLNPLAHADPIGTIAMPLLAGIFHYPPLGWGKPVPFQPAHFTRKISMRAGSALVSVAGPLANIIQAAITLGVAALLVFAIHLQPAQHPGVFAILGVFLTLNMMLAVFNLLPIHPLDGGKILSWALPARFDFIDDFLTRYGWAILLGLMFAAPQILGYVFTPLYILAAKLMAAISPDWAEQYVQWLKPAR
jgi:Zn-dependent protease